jgi:predicted Rossmann-fold nucleotide-binding protein
MGAVSASALRAGGRVHGVIPKGKLCQAFLLHAKLETAMTDKERKFKSSSYIEVRLHKPSGCA